MWLSGEAVSHRISLSLSLSFFLIIEGELATGIAAQGAREAEKKEEQIKA